MNVEAVLDAEENVFNFAAMHRGRLTERPAPFRMRPCIPAWTRSALQHLRVIIKSAQYGAFRGGRIVGKRPALHTQKMMRLTQDAF